MAYLLDSNVIIDILGNRIPASATSRLKTFVDDGFFISVITKIEILGFSTGSAQLNKDYESFVDVANIYELTPAIVKQTIEIRKKVKIKLPDAIIAATALVHNLTFLTHNLSDFSKIPELDVLDSHSL
jgi:predicted nucleic acid-binding protein